MISKLELKNQMKKILFLQKLPFLQMQTFNQVHKIVHSFMLKTYGLNNLVFKQNDTPTHVFIVYQGNFEILRKNKIGKKN